MEAGALDVRAILALRASRRQRYADRYENMPFYGWSEDKARQYSVPERADFGAFVRKQGFTLK